VSGTLSGRTAVVTGAASGIGLGIVTRLIADGAKVFAATRSKEDLECVSEHAAIAGGFVGELHEPGAADDLVATAVETLGRVDALINNAGGGVIRPTLEHTEESLRATVDNNLWTTIYSVRAALPHMVSRGHGRIVNIGADSVRTGLVAHAMYNAAKWGACNGHRPGTRVRRRRRHGEHRRAVLCAHTGTGESVRIRPSASSSGARRRGGNGHRADRTAR
jgi:2,3-dihydroxy-2,3-dihydro-p-cumate dehydrogenase